MDRFVVRILGREHPEVSHLKTRNYFTKIGILDEATGVVVIGGKQDEETQAMMNQACCLLNKLESHRLGGQHMAAYRRQPKSYGADL